MNAEQIHIRLIDGTEVLVPVLAEKVTETQFKLLDSEAHQNAEQSELFEFFPGDVVELSEQTFKDGTKGLVAKRLIKAGNYPDRKFKDFKFKATSGQIDVVKRSAEMYSKEIERLLKENSMGQFHYPDLVSTSAKLKRGIWNLK